MSVFIWHEIRYQCPECGRFVAESNVFSEDRIDPESYWGVDVDWRIDCTKCGLIEVQYPPVVPIREHVEVAEP